MCNCLAMVSFVVSPSEKLSTELLQMKELIFLPLPLFLSVSIHHQTSPCPVAAWSHLHYSAHYPIHLSTGHKKNIHLNFSLLDLFYPEWVTVHSNYTLYQDVHSIWVKHMTLVLIVPCCTALTVSVLVDNFAS